MRRRVHSAHAAFWAFALLVSPVEAQTTKKKTAPKAADKAATRAAARDAAAEKLLLKQTTRVQTAYLKDLEGIAAWAAKGGLKAEAEAVLNKIAALDPEHKGLEKLKASVAKAAPPADEAKARELQAEYPKKLDSASTKNADRLFALATSCMKLGLFTRAYDIIHAVIEADPDHKRARDILSYSWDSAAKAWISKWEADRRKTHFITDEGWVLKKDKEKWDKGRREYNAKWISKEEEERIRKRNDYNPFFVETEHFRVETNLGRKQALEFANLLEDFHGQFFRFFIGYYDQEVGVKLLFKQAKLKSKHRVKVFPSHADYLNFVKAEKGNNKLARESGGFYAEGDRFSYFFWTDNRESTLDTLYHEVTHQLLDETKGGRGSSQGNNWVVEGIASYMETWKKIDGKWKPGHDLRSRRLEQAKGILAANADWSLSSFIAIGNKEFHEEGRGGNYALSAALCHFLLHGAEEAYREPFIRFIADYYAGKAVADSLGKAIPVEGVPPGPEALEALEKQFKEYMKRLGSPEKSVTAEVDGEGKKGEPSSE